MNPKLEGITNNCREERLLHHQQEGKFKTRGMLKTSIILKELKGLQNHQLSNSKHPQVLKNRLPNRTWDQLSKMWIKNLRHLLRRENLEGFYQKYLDNSAKQLTVRIGQKWDSL